MKTISKFIFLFLLFISLSCSDLGSDGSTDEPIEEPVSLANIQGDWFRVESDTQGENGMMINVDGDNGEILIHQESGLLPGDIKWMDIVGEDVNNFNHMELGSDYNYHQATMALGTDDTLRISVAGTVNIEKWARNYDWIDPDDCTPYSAEGSNQQQSSSWDAVNETDNYPGFLPATNQLGGGIYTVTLSNDSEIVPGINIVSENGVSGTIINGTGAGTDTPTVRQVAFLAHPGVSYNVDAHYSSYVVSPNPPVAYNLTWTFEGRMDCYEPNDIATQAKYIPKNQTLEAYGLSGFVTNYIESGDDNTYDWYKITKTESSKIRITLESCPSDLWISCRVTNYNNSAQLIGDYTTVTGNANTNQAGSTYYYETGTLPAGTYLIRLGMSGTRKVDLNTTGSVPDFWIEPYQFKVTTVN